MDCAILYSMSYYEFTSFDVDAATAIDEPDEYHWLPDLDIVQHIESYQCPCQPRRLISIYNANEIWVHNQLHRGRLN